MSGSLQLPDATIPLNAGRGVTPPTNPFAQLGQMAETQNALFNIQNNKLAVQERQALGNAYANASIDPTTGLPNMGDVVSSLQGAGQGGALAIPDAVKANQAARLQSYQLNAADLSQTNDRLKPLYTAFAPLAAKPDLSTNDFSSTMQGMAAAGIPMQNAFALVSSTIPRLAPGQSSTDPAYIAQLQGYARSLAARGWDPGTAATQFTPKTQAFNLGGTTVTADVNPNTNPNATSMTFQNSMDPGTANSPTPGPLVHGAPTTETRQQFVNQSNAGAVGGYNFGTGRPGGNLPPALIGPNGAGGAAPLPATTGSVPGGGIITGLSPAQTAGQTAAATASAGQWAAANQAAGGSAGRIYQLNSALTALQGANTGAGSDRVQQLDSVFQTLAPGLASAFGVDPTEVQKYDLANKYLTAYASSAASKFGATTDSQLATALSANASTHISNLAATDVVKANLGLESMNQDLVRDFQNGVDPSTGQSTGQTPGPEQFSNYASQWNASTDARAYVMPYLPQADATQMIAGMSPPDQAKFYATYQRGINSGAIKPPAWAQPQQTAAPAGTSPPPAQPDPTHAPVQAPAPQGAQPSGQ